MIKQKIIPNTIMFIVIVVSISLFKYIFGDINSLVAVTGITAALCLLDIDYTINPIKNTIYFIVLEVSLGIASYIASLNSFLALIITFLVIFYSIYTFTYNTRKPVYIGFTLGYFFMLYTPIPLEKMPVRLLGLATCGLAIMLLQLITNKNLLQKQTTKNLKIILNSIREQLKLINGQNDIKNILDINKENAVILRKLIDMLYDYIDRGTKLSLYLFEELFIIYFLNSLNIKINEILITDQKININDSKKITNILQLIEDFVDDKSKLDNLINELNKHNSLNNSIEYDNYTSLELNLYIDILRDDLKNSQNNNAYNSYLDMSIKDKFHNLKNNIGKNSLKFNLAFRGALITSIGVFIVSLFNIELGKWLIFTFNAIIQPYSDHSKTKGYQRLYGTVIGLALFKVLFSIFTTTTARTLILLTAGYLSTFPENYGYQIVFITISALGAASMTSTADIVGFRRIFFVIIGTVIALFANKLILPYKISEATKLNIKNITFLNKKIFYTVYRKYFQDNVSQKSVNMLLRKNKLINKNIDYNNTIILSEDLNEYIYNQHTFINDIRLFSYTLINIEKVSYANKKLFKYINSLIKDDLSTENLYKYLDSIDDNLSKLALIAVFRIKFNMLKSDFLSDNIFKVI